jgi:hypothetical protein
MASGKFSVGDLTAVIGDNEAEVEHRAGYNGIWSLTHKTQERNLFVPTVAGMNLEHIYDGQTLDPPGQTRLFFEPRNAPMTFKRLSDSSAELHQPPTPTFFLESWSTFTLREPDAIDFTFRCRATQHVFRRGYIGLFWASYINAPDDKSLYFRDKKGWQQHCTAAHNSLSTVVHDGNTFEPTFVEGHRDCLYQNFSPLKYDSPFYYGLFGRHIVILMFDRAQNIRFTHSPSGGGFNAEAQTSNPAWDFQFLVPKYDVMQDYGFRARLIYRERCSRAEVLKAYEQWRAGLELP